jgi:hypothetical protein
MAIRNAGRVRRHPQQSEKQTSNIPGGTESLV